MKKIILLLVLFNIYCHSQTPTYIPTPIGYGLNSTWSDRAMEPVFIKDNFLICYTTTQVGTVQRYFLVKVNMTTNETYVYPYSNLAGYVYAFRPRNFKVFQNDVYFNCGTKLYKLNFLTDEISEVASLCFLFYIFDHYLIYDYNSTNMYVKDLNTTSAALEMKLPNNISFGEPKGFYEYNNQLYFRATGKAVVKFTAPNLTSYLYSNTLSSTITSASRDNVISRVNDNLIYPVISGNTFKYISVNLTSGSTNTNFAFDTGTNNQLMVKDTFVLNNTVYLVNTAGIVYSSNGINLPTIANLPFNADYYNYTYNNEAYSLISTPTYGNEIWKTNGTPEGTTLFKDINLGTGGLGSWIGLVHNNYLFSNVRYTDSGGITHVNIYASDGTSVNTTPIFDDLYFTILGNAFPHNNNLFFYADRVGESGLYKTDISQYNLTNTDFDTKNTIFYPNPTNSKLYFTETVDKIEIYTLTGSLIYSEKNKDLIDVSELQNGVYIIKIENNDVVTNKKIVKE